MRHLTIAIVALATSCGAQAAQAAGCEGWRWDKMPAWRSA
jgi:hypothetical protein